MRNPFKRNNRVGNAVVKPVDPRPLYSKELLEHVRKLMAEENSKTMRTAATQTRPSFLLSVKKRASTPSWFMYDVDLQGHVVRDGIKINCPTKLQEDATLPKLTLEMLLEKQEVAERKRQKHLADKKKGAKRNETFKQRKQREEREREAKITDMVSQQKVKLEKAAENRRVLLDERRKAARESVQIKKVDKSAENDVKRQAKIIKLSLKQQQAELNRKEHLQLIKAKAATKLINAKTQVVEAQRNAKAHIKAKKNAKKMDDAAASKERTMRRVVNKQKLREKHAEQVRARVAKMQRDEEEINEFDNEWNEMEVDETFQDSNETFWE